MRILPFCGDAVCDSTALADWAVSTIEFLKKYLNFYQDKYSLSLIYFGILEQIQANSKNISDDFLQIQVGHNCNQLYVLLSSKDTQNILYVDQMKERTFSQRWKSFGSYKWKVS